MRLKTGSIIRVAGPPRKKVNKHHTDDMKGGWNTGFKSKLKKGNKVTLPKETYVVPLHYYEDFNGGLSFRLDKFGYNCNITLSEGNVKIKYVPREDLERGMDEYDEAEFQHEEEEGAYKAQQMTKDSKGLYFMGSFEGSDAQGEYSINKPAEAKIVNIDREGFTTFRLLKPGKGQPKIVQFDGLEVLFDE